MGDNVESEAAINPVSGTQSSGEPPGFGLPAGLPIDRYVVIKQLGQGGMGVVFKVFDTRLERAVALKLLKVGERSQGSVSASGLRMLREAQALAKLNHPNIVTVYDAGFVADDIYVTMELAEGQTLRQWVRGERRSRRDVLTVMAASGRGLEAAHNAGLVHRDFKPDNIIVGEQGVARVIDFGLARAETGGSDFDSDCVDCDEVESTRDLNARTARASAVAATPVNADDPTTIIEPPSGPVVVEPAVSSPRSLLNAALTQNGKVIGTPLFMAPEQLRGSAIDARADQYSFCVVLFELLYRREPFGRDSLRALAEGQVDQPDPGLVVPRWLQRIVRRGLSREPRERFESMAQLLEALADDPEVAARERRQARRRFGFVAALAVLAMGLPASVWYEFAVRRSALCKGGAQELSAVWNPQARADVREALLGTGVSYAKDTADRVTQTLDLYGQSWTSMFTETCRATRVGGQQSVDVMDARMSCLWRQLDEMDALTAVLKEADAKVVERAAQAAVGLTPLSSCADVDALMAARERIKPPKDEEIATKVQALRRRLAEVRALGKAGKYREGLELAERLAGDARAVDYQPLQAAVLVELGDLLDRNGDSKGAETTLRAAARAAGESKNDRLAGKAMSILVWVVGHQDARLEEGLWISRAAEVLLGLAGGDAALQSSLLNNTGLVYYRNHRNQEAMAYFRQALVLNEQSFGAEDPRVATVQNNMANIFRRQGKNDEALEYYRKALAIREKAHGPEHPNVSSSLNNLGVLFQALGEYDEALLYYQRSLAIRRAALGPKHPYVAMSLNNMGVAAGLRGDSEAALQYHHQALAIREEVLGPAHPRVAWVLSGIGAVYIDQGKHSEAIEALERSLRICEEKACEPDHQRETLFSLARALDATNADTARALGLAKQARELYRQEPKALPEDLAAVNTWLRERGVR